MDKQEEFINIHEKFAGLTPKLHRLLRLGMVDQDELETVRRALKQGERALTNPLLRDKLLDLLNKFIKTLEADGPTFIRFRDRVQKGKMK